ncbi:MAG: GNAT family N-acetyltransferase [Lachnospiraceae bacterium]|jgi:ribosomal protein S18 acetylase RimI-like enzyme|nr:GNAT family N-acetyltransferase [Lachnospiraceae bacterium]MCI9133143.1 GNAT family N-acetyltransferase [Lachnospiraceae bacterium]
MDRQPVFDNLDHRIRYIHLLMERDLEGIPHFDLPEGYRFVFYEHGNRDTWIEIEKSAGEFLKYEEGLEAWKKYYEICEQDLPARMLFIENEAGEKVATATAYDGSVEGEAPHTGLLHWVSVRKEYQGKGLARPLICKTLETLKSFSYQRVQLSTQTTTWVACKLYLDFGFRPTPENAREAALGWRILKRLTGHPALGDFSAATEEELLDPKQ